MGSGSSGIYSGTGGGSQPYAESYHVVNDMLSSDKKDPDIYNSSTGYFKNPTATTIEDAISGNRVEIDGKVPDGPITYVMDTDGNIIIGRRVNPNNGLRRAPHPTLIGGKDPQVQCAGMIRFRKGKILSVNNASGHYRPNVESMSKVNEALQRLYDSNPNLFAPGSKWRKNNE